MPFPCAGAYGGVIVKTELVKGSGDKSSRSFSLYVEFDEYFWPEQKAFSPCEKFDEEVPNWIVKADGTLNDKAIEKLAAIIGFDGVERDYAGTRVRVDVQDEEYKGKTVPKVKWLNNADWVPGASSYKPLEASEKSQFASQFGSQIRALTARPGQSPAPVGRPVAPPARRPAAAPVAAVAAPDEPGSNDGSEPPF